MEEPSPATPESAHGRCAGTSRTRARPSRRRRARSAHTPMDEYGRERRRSRSRSPQRGRPPPPPPPPRGDGHAGMGLQQLERRAEDDRPGPGRRREAALPRGPGPRALATPRPRPRRRRAGRFGSLATSPGAGRVAGAARRDGCRRRRWTTPTRCRALRAPAVGRAKRARAASLLSIKLLTLTTDDDDAATPTTCLWSAASASSLFAHRSWHISCTCAGEVASRAVASRSATRAAFALSLARERSCDVTHTIRRC